VNAHVDSAVSFVRRDAAHGVLWLREAYVMFSAHRLRWLSLLLAYYVVLVLVDALPWVGPIVAPILKPVFAVGFLAAAWSQQRGEPPRLAHLFRGFRADLRALLALGAALVAGVIVAIGATWFVDGGRLLEALSGAARFDEMALGDGRVQAAMVFAAVAAIPVVLALWFAPALVVFQDCGARRALATSLAAAVANWRPVVVYALLVFFWGAFLPGIVAAAIAALLPQSTAQGVAVIVLFPYVAMFVAILHISDYVSYRDIFHPDEAAAPQEPPGGSAAA
jgi:hypothetical protein